MGLWGIRGGRRGVRGEGPVKGDGAGPGRGPMGGPRV